MLGAVVRENTEPVSDGGGLSRGPETATLGDCHQPHCESSPEMLSKHAGRGGWVGCVGSRPQGSWSCQCLLVLQSLGFNVPRYFGERAEPVFGMSRDWPCLVRGFPGSLVFLHVSMLLCLCSASG